MKNIFKNKYFLLVLAIVFFSAGTLFYYTYSGGAAPTISGFESVLHKKEIRLNEEMLSLAKRAESENYNDLFTKKPSYYNLLMQEEGIALLIYENDTLKFWSDNSIAVENWVKEICLDSKMAKLHNGWFEVVRPHTNATTTKAIVGLVLVKNEYPYQNKYLVNEFQKDFAVPAETKLITDNPNATNGVKNYKGEYLFSLEFDPTNNSISLISYISVLLSLSGFVFLILFLKSFCSSFFSPYSKNFSTLAFIFLAVSVRYILIKFSFPDCFYSFDLFSPKIFANASSVWLTSLGDLLINVVLMFYLTFVFLNNFEFDVLVIQLKKVNTLVISFAFFLAFFWFSWALNVLFIGLIKNSNIPFSINNLFTLNQYSYVGIIIIGLLLFVYFLLADKMVAVLKMLKLNNRQYIFVFIISAGIHTFISHFLGTLDLIVIFWPFLLVLSIAIIKKKQTIYPFSSIIFLVFLFSLYAVHVFIKHSAIKEVESRKIYAEKLAAEQDPVAELLFQDVDKKLHADTVLLSLISGFEKHPEEFEKRIKQQYFSGFWEKYDVRVALFDSACAPIIRSQNPLFDNNFYFDELIEKKGQKTSCVGFYFINNSSGKISYLAKIPLYKKPREDAKYGTIYIELDAKFISDEVGFPELLLDRNIGLSQELSNYSYAKYKHNQLLNQYGKYSYSLNADDFKSTKIEFDFQNKEEFNHLLFRPNPETLIVLSKRNDGLIGKVTTFSYLFAFFSLLLLSILVFRQISLGQLFEHFSFKYRIQVLLVLIVLISLALFGGGTIYYIKQQFEVKNKENISEKIHSVQIDVEGKLSAENTFNKGLTEYVSFILKKSSSVFFTDINFYDVQGNLYASSRSKVFDEGLTSKKMNPEAFLQIAILGKTEFIHDERIGKLEYLSAYIPFKNKDGKLLAYLNLPYFAKQSELEKEISGFLVALINIYVLLFALSIVTAIFISNYVTKPLKLIQDKLSKIKLGKTNEPIDWKENDEIGNLVSEYNRMIAELSKSADLLAKSERESAWREMAKQVAHEIKNPLTPMKLSVQHLQRTWKDGAPDMDQKMERLTKTIIEQIDTLSNIATEFSNFAKMPKANLEKINIKEIIVNTIALFHDSENLAITFETEISAEAFVFADKEQLLRVFNNLIKNAVQAIPEEQKGEIIVSLKKEKQQFLISVFDNGNGIDNDVIDKIFVPNFTTKTGGMGLGLAMVKNIVETANGRIWFETKSGKGTTFYVTLPCFVEE
ncbi:MAG: HAMP domain-containing sensor histidine kinase [Bacteroidetes bacterium]|nr:HAMP domain-containing sensor histidine kinase [Bacteroidota bacterium]